MSSTMSLVRRGSTSCHALKSPSWNINYTLHPPSRRLDYSPIHTTTLSSKSRSILIESRVTRHWIQSFHRMTLHPHLYQPLKHTGRLSSVARASALRCYHRSSRTQSRSMAEEITQEVSNADYSLFEAASIGTTRITHNPPQSVPTPRPRRSGSVTIRDSPLFSRRVTARKWPVGSGSNEAPKYRVVQDQEVYRLSSSDFDPFIKYPIPKTDQRLSSHPNYAEEGSQQQRSHPFWSVNSLPLATAQSRHGIWRKDTPKFDPSTNPNATLDEAIGMADESGDLARSAGSDATAQSPYQPIEFLELNTVQSKMVTDLVSMTKDPSSTLSKRRFTTELQMLGRATLLRWKLPLAFVDSAATQQDVIGVGLDTLVSAISRSTDSGSGLSIQLADILMQNNMLLPLDEVSIDILYASIIKSAPQSHPCIDQSHKETLLKSLDGVRSIRDAKTIDHEEWKIQTRRFRLQLAVARETGIMPSEDEYLKFMRSCQKANHIQELELTFHHYMDFHSLGNRRKPSPPSLPSEQIYREYIKGLVRGGRIDHAQEVLYSMKRRGVTPSIVTYGVMIEGYGRQMDLQKIRMILKSMHVSGHYPTLEIYTSMITNYIKVGEIERADDVCRQLIGRDDIKTDGQFKNVLANLQRLGGSKEFNTQISKEEEVLPEPSDPGNGNADSTTAEYNIFDPRQLEREKKRLDAVIGFNHQLKKYADSLNTVQFTKKYKALLQNGLRPNTTTQNILLTALLKGGELEDGLQVLEDMKSTDGAQPDVVTFGTLINGAVNRKDVDLGWELYSDMRSRSILPSLHIYVSLIELAGLDPSNVRGREIVKQYSFRTKKRVRFSVKAKVEDQVGLNFAGDLYNQLCHQGLKPNHHVFCTLLNMVVRGGYMDLAQRVYGEMLHQNIEPNTAIMTSLIKGFAVRNDFESGWKAWKHMVENNIPRNAITYNHLIRLCERSLRDPLQKKRILESFRSDDNTSRFDNKASGPREKKQELTGEGEEELDLLSDTEGAQRKTETRNMKAEEEVLKTQSRIPLEILTEIQDQMKLDHVHWSRVHQYRRKDIDRTVWQPIARKLGPVMSTTAVGADGKTLEGFGFSAPSASQSRQEKEFDGLGLAAATMTSTSNEAFSTTTTIPPVRSIYTGGRNLFTPKRMPKDPMVLKWDAKSRVPKLQTPKLQTPKPKKYAVSVANKEKWRGKVDKDDDGDGEEDRDGGNMKKREHW
ncbi:hypothetical protein BGX27_006863 [Mortierella sp. AM989]|nr:hypothetical protein BGX27_006863 [Mortierella sp. AM989]